MAKILGRLTKIAFHATAGSLTGHTTIGRLISGQLSADETLADSSDYDDGADDTFEYDTRNSKITANFNRDQTDAGQILILASKDSQTKGSMRYRVKEITGIEEYIQDALVTNQTMVSGRPDMQKLNLAVQLSGARTRQNQP